MNPRAGLRLDLMILGVISNRLTVILFREWLRAGSAVAAGTALLSTLFLFCLVPLPRFPLLSRMETQANSHATKPQANLSGHEQSQKT